MTQREKLLAQGINPDALRVLPVPSGGKCRQTGAFRKREQFIIAKWSWAR